MSAAEDHVLHLYFVRHGESGNNVLWDAINSSGKPKHIFYEDRHPDPDLTERGQKQVECVAERIAQEVPDLQDIYVSYLHRALRTAEALHQRLPRATVILDRDAAEIGGHYHFCRETKQFVATAGRSNKDIRGLFPTFAKLDERCEAGWYEQQGVEPAHSASLRARALIDKLMLRHKEIIEMRVASDATSQPPVSIAVVTHGDFLVLLRSILSAERMKSSPANKNEQQEGKDEQQHHVVKHSHVRNTAVTKFAVSRSGEWLLELDGCTKHLDGRCEMLADA